jgi:hypothetical protein
MLFKSHNEDQIIYSETSEGIDLKSYSIFKYKIPKHDYLPICIARFVNRTVIYPNILECHPKTSLKDIEVKDEVS